MTAEYYHDVLLNFDEPGFVPFQHDPAGGDLFRIENTGHQRRAVIMDPDNSNMVWSLRGQVGVLGFIREHRGRRMRTEAGLDMSNVRCQRGGFLKYLA